MSDTDFVPLKTEEVEGMPDTCPFGV